MSGDFHFQLLISEVLNGIKIRLSILDQVILHVTDLTNKGQLDSLKDKMVGKGEFISGFSTSFTYCFKRRCLL